MLTGMMRAEQKRASVERGPNVCLSPTRSDIATIVGSQGVSVLSHDQPPCLDIGESGLQPAIRQRRPSRKNRALFRCTRR